MNEKSIESELKTRSYTEDNIAETLDKQVLIIPQFITTNDEMNISSQLVRSDVADIKKVLSQAGYETEIILDKRLKRRVLVQKDADIVLPLILFAASIPLGIAIGYISNWLFARFGDQQRNVKYKHARFRPDGTIEDYIELEGNPKEVADILKSGNLQSADLIDDNQPKIDK